MHSIFYKIYLWIAKNKVLTLIVALLFLIISAFFASQIKFEEDISRIIPKNENTSITAKVLDQLNFSDKITVIIEKTEQGSIDDMVDIATVFLDSLDFHKDYVNSVQGKIDEENINNTFEFVYEHLPLFLEEDDYIKIIEKIKPDSITNIVENNYKTLISPTGIVAKEFLLKDPFGIGFMGLKKLQEINIGDDFYLYDGFVTTKDNTKLFLFINPKYSGNETQHNTFFVDVLNSIKSNLNTTYESKASIDYFGATFVAVANAKQIKSDIQKTVVISLTVLLILLIVFYRNLLIPIIIFIPSIFGALFALAIMYFIKDSISAISLSIGAILLGITIDYSLHTLTHYKHSNNIRELYLEITKPLIMSAGTTAIAFLCLLFVNSESLKDLGIFASITVFASGIFSLLITPHLYRPKTSVGKIDNSLLYKISRYPFDRKKYLFISCLALIFISLFTFNKVGFNDDLSALNYFPEELKQAEAKLENAANSNSKSLYIASYGTDLNTVVSNNSKLCKTLNQDLKDDKILQLSSLGSLILSKDKQQYKIERWKQFWKENDIERLKQQLIQKSELFGFKPETYQNFYDLLQTDFETIEIEEYRNINPHIIDEFIIEKDGFYTMSNLVKVSEEQRDLFVENISKSKDIIVIDRKKINETFLGELVNDFNSLINYSLIAIFVILWFFFRRIELVIVSMIPILVSGFVITGLLGLFNIEFNIFSTIVCTLIFGHGVDFSIFMTSALQKEYTTGKDEMPTYRVSIILAVITTILSIGAMIFAKHPALKSISVVSLIGVFIAVLYTFVFYPKIFRFCFVNRPIKGKSPITLRLFIHSSLSFIYFGVFGIIYSVIIRIFIRIAPINEIKKYKIFGKGMSLFMKSVLYSNPFVKKEIINKYNETFEKPAVIISNHTSFLDSVAIGMVNPNIVFLINDWVYNSPIFGKAVKMAGFYPISKGIEGSVDILKKRVEQGFSLMVFPEGTRSTTNDINRLHKGAFYLAEQLELDILPIFIHGNSEVIPKGDHIIYNGQIINVIDKRISRNDLSFGSNYSERTKKIGKYFKSRFQEIRDELETEDYFRDKLFLSFLYKNDELINAVKLDFNKYKKIYLEWNKFIKSTDKILHISDDYGQRDFLLTMQQAKRRVETWIENENNRDIARTNYVTKIRKIVYLNDISEASNNLNVLLVSNGKFIDSIPLNIEKIIQLKFNNESKFSHLEFASNFENEFFTVLERKHYER